MTTTYKAICIGAGPAGLTAAYLLAKAGQSVLVLEQDPTYVGGISRTEGYKGYLCDIGGHRFFSKSEEVVAFWDEILGDDFLQRPRKSRIFYNKKFFNYPLSAWDALSKLGVIESGLCVLSYAKAYCFPLKQPKNFQEWVANQFGYRLFSIFFKTYTEKVWGMACTEISADWAAQRIKGLSLGKAIMNAMLPKKKAKGGDKIVKTLIDKFRYPKRGPGMMWETATQKTQALGGDVQMGQTVTKCHFDGKLWHVTATNLKGEEREYLAEHVISSMPLSALVRNITPAVSAEVRAAADGLKYRDFLIVSLIVKDRDRFDDNWIYIHDPSVRVGRIQNFKSWSPMMVPDAANNCLGMEYFCFDSDGIWKMADAELVKLATGELVQLGLAAQEDVLDGFVVRQPKAYPVYDFAYKQHLETIRSSLSQHFNTLHPVGRNGMHRYNNQDHSMMTAMLSVKNILAGKAIYNTWQVNEDAEYHEEISEADKPAGRQVPMPVSGGN